MRRFFGGSERRSSLANPEPWLIQAMSGPTSMSGIPVNAANAANNMTVYACGRYLAETISTLPVRVLKKKKGGGKEIAIDHPLHKLLAKAPNRLMTSFAFREQMMWSLSLRAGNSFAELVRDGAGRIAEIMPRQPEHCELRLTPDGLTFELDIRVPGQPKRTLLRHQFWHVSGVSTNGLVGVAPLLQMKDAIGLAMAAERYGAKFYANAARPSGVLSSDGILDEEAAIRMEQSIARQTSGEQVGRILVLDGGMKFSSMTMSAEEAQFLQTRSFQVVELARGFRVPPHKIAHLEGATFSNIEHQSIEVVVDTLTPWAERIEQSADRDLLSDNEREDYSIELDFNGMLRGDAASRSAYYDTAIKGGWLSRAEARGFENLNEGPPELADFLVPMNMSAAGSGPVATGKPAGPPGATLPKVKPGTKQEPDDDDEEPEPKP